MASEAFSAPLVVKELTWWLYNCIWKVSKHVPVVPPGYVYMWLWFMTLMIPSLDLLMSSYLAPGHINSLAPGRFEGNFRWVNFKLIVVIDGWCISCEIAIRWMPLDITDDKSTLVQVMAWCHQAPSHYLSQCWPRFLLPYGVTRPQWVNPLGAQLVWWNLNIFLHVLIICWHWYAVPRKALSPERPLNLITHSLDTSIIQVVEILLCGKSAQNISAIFQYCFSLPRSYAVMWGTCQWLSARLFVGALQ